MSTLTISRKLKYSELPGYSKLFLDTLAGKLTETLKYDASLASIAGQLSKKSYLRNELTAILAAQAENFNADAASKSSIENFREDKSIVVIAGQQAGWYGGPMLSLIKAIAVAKAAKQWTASLGVPVIPVFWIAADDHDLDEIRSTTVLNRSGQLTVVEYPNDQRQLSAGESLLGDRRALDDCFTALQAALGEGEFASPVYDLVRECYREGESYASAFGKLMARLTSGTGLVLFTPSDKALKQLAAPWFEMLIERQTALSSEFVSRNELLQTLHYQMQVEKKPDSAFLFHHAPERQAITTSNDKWISISRTWTTNELLTEIKQRPETFSPNVLSRPLLQSWLFPVVAQFAGPSEIAYLHQVAPMFEQMNIVRPLHLARPGVTLIDKRTEELMTSAHCSFENVLSADPEEMIARLLSDTFPQSVQAELDQVRLELRDRASQLSPLASSLDPQMAEFANQTAGKIDFLVGQFSEKLIQAHRKKEKETRERWKKAFQLVAPNRGQQERTTNILSFVARYGPNVPHWIYESIDPDTPDHRLLVI